MLTHSPLESDRFGLKIYRGIVEQIDLVYLQDIIKNHLPDILIFRIPCEKQFQIHQLNALGFPVIAADTLVYYRVDLEALKPALIKNSDIQLITGNLSHKVAVEDIVKKTFKNYTNHYFSNPLLDKTKILEGYQEWALKYFDEKYPDQMAWLVRKNGDFVALMTCSYTKYDCEIILNSVKPEHQGQGIYSDLVRYAQEYFKSRGIKTMRVSTQIQNYRVQNVWLREGFTIEKAYNTIHINCMLTTKH